MPVPVATAERHELVDPEHLERRRRPDDVDDGVVPADLVEVHLVDRTAVQRRLDAGQGAERGQGPLGHPVRQRSLRDERGDRADGSGRPRRPR